MAGITEALQKEAGKQMVEKVLENVDKDKLVDAAGEEWSDHICVRETESCFFRAQSQIILLYLSFG